MKQIPDWVEPGMMVYATPQGVSTPEEVMELKPGDLAGIVVRGRHGLLFVVDANVWHGPDEYREYNERFEKDRHFRTFAEALRADARMFRTMSAEYLVMSEAFVERARRDQREDP